MAILRERSLSEYAFLASVAISIAGTCIALGGLAGLQAFCDDNNGIYSGLKTEYLAGAKIKYAGVSCAKIFRFEWWGWALQCFFLIVSITCWMTENVHTFKSALWSMAATAIVLAMYQADELVDLYEKTIGDLHTRGVVTFLGYCGFCAGDYLMMFTGNALYHVKRAEFMAARQASLVRRVKEGNGSSGKGDTAANEV